MKSIIGTMAVLLLLVASSQVMASPTMTFTTSFNDATHQLEVVVLMNANGGSTKKVSSINAGFMLTGTDASKFTPVQFAGQTNNQVAAAVAPAPFALYVATDSTASSVSALAGSGIGESFGYSIKSGSGTLPVLGSMPTGSALAVFFFNYTGTYASLTNLTGTVTAGDFTGTAPAFSFSDFTGDRVGTVANNGVANNMIPVPEPATMGLLGLGLIGLIARRKK